VDDLAERIRESIRRREVIVIVGDCEVEYRGRASSRLGRGERVILIKGDGTVLVHRPSGANPVNYQPEGSIVSVYEQDGRLVLRSLRPRPEEELVIVLHRVLDFRSYRLEDTATFKMWGDEESIKRAILLEPEAILGESLKPVEEEVRLGAAGYADLMFVDESGNYVVVEVKKDTAGVEAVYQLKRYVDRLRNATGFRVRGILAAPGFTRSAIIALGKEGLEFRRVDMRKVYELTRGGIANFL